MRLYLYECRKLFWNWQKLALLGVVAVTYFILAFTSVFGEYELNQSEIPNAYDTYVQQVETHRGSYDEAAFQKAQEVVAKAFEVYGRGEGFNQQRNRDPQLRFAFEYVQFGNRVNQYWHGVSEQRTTIIGVLPVEAELARLTLAGETQTYEYRFYEQYVAQQIAIGEPQFSPSVFWGYYAVNFDPLKIVFGLLLVMTYFIAPLFTQEIASDMDSIILCTKRGRRQLVLAKIAAASTIALIIVGLYFGMSWLGTYAIAPDISGLQAAAQTVPGFEAMPFALNVGQVILVNIGWFAGMSVVFTSVLVFISAKTQTTSAAFGLGLVVTLAGGMLSYLAPKVQALIWPLVDFNYSNLFMVQNIFGTTKNYDVFGWPIPYWLCAVIVSLVLLGVGWYLIYRSQQTRSAK